MFPAASADFQAKLRDPSSNGAVFFAVCRCDPALYARLHASTGQRVVWDLLRRAGLSRLRHRSWTPQGLGFRDRSWCRAQTILGSNSHIMRCPHRGYAKVTQRLML